MATRIANRCWNTWLGRSHAERTIAKSATRIGDAILAARLQTLMANLLLMEGNLEGARELH
ncbi:MAG: hypothetical protein IPK19_36060 [Chloroflexi bacterium]|nr:hypothetical protein [Chloroflexota bacterium]